MDNIFEKAANHAKNLQNLSENEMLKLYGLYKQAVCGPCNISKPYFWDFTAKAKWESWKSMKDLSQCKSKQEYVEYVKHLDPEWNESDDEEELFRPKGLGVSVSVMHHDKENEISDTEKTVFDWCKEGNLDRLKLSLQKEEDIKNCTDVENLSILHWAVDRNHFEIVEYLLKLNCYVDPKDNDLQTPLHYAVTCEYIDIVKILLFYGADTSLKDVDGNQPKDCSYNKCIKELFLK